MINNINNIRNFCIIAHIDHGKSTLADRFLEITGTIEKRKMREQYLDMHPLEKERGITIKLQPVQMLYFLKETEEKFILNLIDTPGHVDFSYEVSRSLACVEGAILLVDATKGIQAQTLANFYLAQEQNLKIVPVINKIDLAGARIQEVKNEMKKFLNVKEEEILEISAKSGKGVEKVLKEVIKRVPSPMVNFDQPLKALIFDSFFDPYKGVIIYVRIFKGKVAKNQKIAFYASGAFSEILEVGIFKPQLKKTDFLTSGNIGYIVTGLKDIRKCRVGDTIVKLEDFKEQKVKPLVGYKEPKPMVFASFYPHNTEDYEKLHESLLKLRLNDASFIFEPELSEALGRGFRCGFLGLLHLDIITERIRREYKIELIVTIPSVIYKVVKTNDEEIFIRTPSQLPLESQIKKILEPIAKVEIISPSKYLGNIMKLMESKRAIYLDTKYFSENKLLLIYEMPMSELITDFYDKLKSVTKGYASLNYEFLKYKESDLVRLDILVAGEKIEALSRIVYRPDAYRVGREIIKKMKELISPRLFVISLQAAIGGKVIARENIKSLRKDVTGYLYGGDYTRKRKLLEKQKKGKKKLKKYGKVKIPPQVFRVLLKK